MNSLSSFVETRPVLISKSITGLSFCLSFSFSFPFSLILGFGLKSDCCCRKSLSLDDDVRGRQEDRDGRDDGERREGDQAEAVDDHGRELPVADDLLLLVVNLHPVGDELELLEDALKLSVGAGRAAVAVHRRIRRRRRNGFAGCRIIDRLLVQRVSVHSDEPAVTVRTS